MYNCRHIATVDQQALVLWAKDNKNMGRLAPLVCKKLE